VKTSALDSMKEAAAEALLASLSLTTASSISSMALSKSSSS